MKMMRVYISCLMIFIFFVPLAAQMDSMDWWMSTNIGIAQHDKRLFDYSEKEALLERNPDFFGTYHFGVSIQKKVISHRAFKGFLGTGINFERATFDRPFNHFHFRNGNFYILRLYDTYDKIQIPLSASFLLKINDKIFLSNSIVTTLILHRVIDNPELDEPFSETVFQLEDLHMNVGVFYMHNDLVFGLSSRIFNYQKIDRIIFNYLIDDPRTNQSWEWYNPLGVNFTVGYMW